MRCAAAATSAVLYGLLFPPFGWTALSWLCLVPLFLALRGVRARDAAALAALWSFVTTALIVVWLVPTLHGHFERSLTVSVAFWLGVALFALCPYYALGFGVAAAAARRVSPGTRVALFAATFVAAEFARTQLGLQSPWTKLGDAHAFSPRLRQIADLGGVYAVSFVVTFANAAIAEAIAGVVARQRAWLAPIAASAALVAASLLYGASRGGTQSAATLPVAIVQANVAPELRWRRDTASRVLRVHVDLTLDALRADARAPALIVWPENAIQTPVDDPSLGPALQRLARRAPLLLGAPRSEERDGVRHHFNSASLLRADGAVATYDKRRLLPFSETQPFGAFAFGARGDLDAVAYTPGDRPGFFDVADQRVAVLICMEALYPSLAREAARGGASLLVNVSNDGWYAGSGGAGQALAQVVFRAVETRLPVVRATTTGISAVVAPDGTIVARIEEGVPGFLDADVPLGLGAPSVYTRAGDWFAVACAAAWIGIAAFARRSSTSSR